MQPIAEMLVKTLPQARLLQVGGAGHVLPLTHGEPVNRAIVTHLGATVVGALRVRQLDWPDMPHVERHLLALDPVDRQARFGVACADPMIAA